MTRFKDLQPEEKAVYQEGYNSARNYDGYKASPENQELYQRGYSEGMRINIEYEGGKASDIHREKQ